MIHDRHHKPRLLLIPGGSRGIGKEIARALCSQFKVVILGRDNKSLIETQEELASSEKIVEIQQLDLGNLEQVHLVCKKIKDELGTPFGIVMSAAIHGEIGLFSQVSFEGWSSAIQVNFLGAAKFVHEFIPEMIAKKSGRVIFFSGGGQGSMQGFSAYVSSKGAVWRLTETLGLELAPFNVFVNAIAPGAVNTKLLSNLLEAGPQRVGELEYSKGTKQKITGGDSPQLAVSLVEFLLSEKSHGLFGKTLSAKWDNYKDFTAAEIEKMARSDIYTFKRVVDFEGKTK